MDIKGGEVGGRSERRIPYLLAMYRVSVDGLMGMQGD